MSLLADQPWSHEPGYAATATDSQNSPSVPEMLEADEEPVSGAPKAFPNQIAHGRSSAVEMRSDESIQPMTETVSEYDVHDGEEWGVQDHLARTVFFESGVSASNVDPFDSPSLVFVGPDVGVADSEEPDKWQLICQARAAKLEREHELELEAHSTIGALEVQDLEGRIKEICCIEEALHEREVMIAEKKKEIQLREQVLEAKEEDIVRQSEDVRSLTEELERKKTEAMRMIEVATAKGRKLAKKVSELAAKELELQGRETELARRESELAKKELGPQKRVSDIEASEKSVAGHEQEAQKGVDKATVLNLLEKRPDDQDRQKTIDAKTLEEDVARKVSKAKKTDEATRQNETNAKI